MQWRSQGYVYGFFLSWFAEQNYFYMLGCYLKGFKYLYKKNEDERRK